MAKSPYRFFTPLNNRRHELIEKKIIGDGLTDKEEKEFEMLQEVCGHMVESDCDILGKNLTDRLEELGLTRRCPTCLGDGRIVIDKEEEVKNEAEKQD